MSRLRPELGNASPGTPLYSNGTAYYMILNAVLARDGLIHGRLEDHHGGYCAIGCYFQDRPRTALPNALIDEVAAVNDSMPHTTSKQRRRRMLQWLRWRLRQCGMTFRGAKPKRRIA